MRREYEYGQEKAFANLEKRANETMLERAAKIGGSAGISGGLLGLGAGLFGGARSLGALGRAALTGGVLSSGVATGANLVGSALVDGSEEDPSANTRRGAIGGGLVGGTAGGAAGLALSRDGQAAGKIGKALPGIAKEGSLLNRGLQFARRHPLGALAGAAGGALLGASAGAFQGADEGMQYDAVMNELRRQRGMNELRRQRGDEL